MVLCSLMGAVIGPMPFVAGCGSSVEGTSAQFDAKANLKQQDAMRSYMQKQMSGQGKAANSRSSVRSHR